MSDGKVMKLLGEAIEFSNDYIHIDELKFLKDNPRVYACTHGHRGFENLIDEEKQEIILEELLKEPSVTNLIPEVKRHGGLMESILIRWDTKEVIEGNSRLAVYRKLRQDEEPGEWEYIPCDIVGKLSDDQQAAFLSQIHVKGKTQWSAYEKANFAYVRKEQGWNVDRIAKVFGESEGTIRTRLKVIEMMKDNGDNLQSHFSFYNVLSRKPEISNAIQDDTELHNFLMGKIKNLGTEGDSEFTAKELRDKLPALLTKPKVLKKFKEGEIDLDEGYQRAKVSPVAEKLRQAVGLLDDVKKSDIGYLEQNCFNAFKQHARKLKRAVDRISGIIAKRDDKGN